MKKDIENLLEEKAPVINNVIEKYIPRNFEKKSQIFNLYSPPKYDYNLEALNRGIAEPIWEFLDRGGKRWRPTLFLLICEALGKDSQELLDFAIIPEVVHNGTLIIDDVEDSSDLRRGKPCTYKKFGIDVAVNVGNSMYYLPLLALNKNKNKLTEKKVNKIYEIYVEEMIKLSLGQAMDIVWHKQLIDVTEILEEQYLQMCEYKTGTLSRMAAKMAAVIADANDDQLDKISRFAESIGVAFQIIDDVLDLVGENFAEKKGGIGKDITEGKLTLMVIHTLKKADLRDKKRLIKIINMHTTDQKMIDRAINIFHKYSAIEYAREYARGIISKSWKKVESILPPSDAKENLRAFANYLIERQV